MTFLACSAFLLGMLARFADWWCSPVSITQSTLAVKIAKQLRSREIFYKSLYLKLEHDFKYFFTLFFKFFPSILLMTYRNANIAAHSSTDLFGQQVTNTQCNAQSTRADDYRGLINNGFEAMSGARTLRRK